MKKATPDTVPEEKIGKDIEDMTVEELKTLAKEKGLTGVSSLAKADLPGDPERVIRWHQQKISKS